MSRPQTRRRSNLPISKRNGFHFLCRDKIGVAGSRCKRGLHRKIARLNAARIGIEADSNFY